MIESLDIADVARRTGLTSRALRFYEARGLVSPLRTASGRRHYGPGELARVYQILTLKRAGFSLAQIDGLARYAHVDLATLVDARIAIVEQQAEALSQTRALLLSVKSRIERSEPIDVATFCSLIQQGQAIMEDENWKPIVDAYFTSAEQDRFRDKMKDVSDGFDQAEYGEKWRDLGGRIEAALPLDPASGAAQAFVDEWFALLKPFSAVATPEMWKGTAKMYDGMSSWGTSPDIGFGPAVWTFIKTATRARLDAGGTVDGPAWMTAA